MPLAQTQPVRTCAIFIVLGLLWASLIVISALVEQAALIFQPGPGPILLTLLALVPLPYAWAAFTGRYQWQLRILAGLAFLLFGTVLLLLAEIFSALHAQALLTVLWPAALYLYIGASLTLGAWCLLSTRRESI